MLSSGAHIGINDDEFMLAEQLGQRSSTFYRAHYNYQRSSLLANRQDISGKPGRQNVINDIMLWAYDSFDGGEGNKFYDPNSPAKYYRSDSGDTRNPGFLTGTPGRTDTNPGSGPTGGVGDPALHMAPVFASGGGYLYMVDSNTPDAGHTPTIYQMDSTFAWRQAYLSDGASTAPLWNRNIAVDQNGNAYVVLGNPTTINRIIRVKNDLSSVLFHYEVDHPTNSNVGAWGAATWEKYLYVWTGYNLYQWDTTSAPTVTPTLVGSTGRDNVSFPSIVADVVNAGDRIIMFVSSAGDTRMYQYARTVSGNATPAFSQMWIGPGNFQAFSAAYMNGTAYIGGQQDGVTTLWGVTTTNNSLTPFLAAQIRPDESLSIPIGHPPTWYPNNVLVSAPMSLGPATNNQLLIGTNDGHVYAYNVLTRAVSLVDSLSIGGGQLAWVGAANGVRLAAWDKAADQTSVSYWAGDAVANGGSAVLETSAWDFDLPENTKLFEGFHVVSDVPTTGKSITISYKVDESASYTPLVTLDNTNTTTGDNFVPMSTLAGSVTGRILRYRIEARGGIKVYSVTARARITDTQEQWDLYILTENEQPNGPRPAGSTRTGAEIRARIRALADITGIVRFRDGYRDYLTGDAASPASGYSTHPVVFDAVEDIVVNDGGGHLHITLKSAGSLTTTPSAGIAPSVDGDP